MSASPSRSLWARITSRLRRRPPRREEGMALIMVVVMLAVIGASAADFSYNARVDFASAINARESLRAHYLARSAINLAKLPLRLQQQMIDRDFYRNRGRFGMDIQLTDYIPLLLQAFKSREDAEGLMSMFGVAAGGIKGLGVGKHEDFDLELEPLDGRINVNCAGGGANAGAPAVSRTAASLAAMMMPLRYNWLFERADKDGQYNDRATVMRGLIDWADQDRQMYGSSAPEDYQYNRGKDPYEVKDNYYDTIEELRLVRGVDELFMNAFGKQLTVYGRCKVSVSLADIPTLMALIMQYAEAPHDPGLEIRNLTLLAHYLVQIRELMGGKFLRIGDFREACADPMAWLQKATAQDSLLQAISGESNEMQSSLPRVTGVKLSPKLGDVAFGSYAQRIFRVIAKAKVGKVEKRIIAIWDQNHISSQAGPGGRHTGSGGFVYWREE
ncbi:MAG: general secretion pathway protein GspK [Deltaproteobacteria bacterium]|nr:general secretion pathway protein GspK [Deltaproteobacteria bacterium]